MAKVVLNIKIEKRVYDVTVTLILVVELSEAKVIFRLSDPKSIRINVKIFKNNSTSGFDLFYL